MIIARPVVFENIPGPLRLARFRIQAVKVAVRAHRVYESVAIHRRRARPRAAQRLIECRRIAERPQLTAGFRIVSGDGFFGATLLDGVGPSFAETEAGITAADGQPPQALRMLQRGQVESG